MNRHIVMMRAAVGLCLLSAGIAAAAPGDVPPTADAQAQLDARIAGLVEQLGAAEYGAREKAQAELVRVGLEAFDALHQAQYNDDIEIALRARYLVRSMNVNWAQETDSPAVQQTLKDYGSQNPTERKTRMDRLAGLDKRQGLVALCRLARFETDNVLSKQAGLLILGQTEPAEAKERSEVARQILAGIGLSKRTATQWLRTYARTLEKPESTLPDWEKHTQEEQATLAQHPERTSREVVRDLYRWHVGHLQHLGRDSDAVAVMRRTIALLDGTPEQVTDIVGWLIDRQAWPVVLEVHERFSETFTENAQLLYSLAETYLKQGNAPLSEETANRAIALLPENPDAHFLVARWLEDKRGLFDWAEREYRLVIKMAPETSIATFRSRFFLSEMLHDRQMELAAAEVLQGMVATLKNSPNPEELVGRFNGKEPGSVYSRMHYFYACDAALKGDAKSHRERLRQGIEKDALDVDVLIALYRLPDQTPADQASTKELIEAAVAQFREEMGIYEEAMRLQTDDLLEQAIGGMAEACNQYAWLVSNTFGDFDDAIKCSQKSIDLAPEQMGPYSDTLGRCYYAKGDLEKAVHHQKQAIKADPHSQQLKRQLAFFEKELASRPTPKKPADGTAKP